MSDHLSREDSIEHIAKIIKDIKYAMLTTTNAEGHLHSRPMTTQQQEFDGALWFIGSRHSATADDIRRQPEVNVGYSDAGKGDYVSLSGRAELVEDRAKLEELWSETNKAWFEGGIDDPEVQLIRIEAHGAEFWESNGRVRTLFQLARAALTGKTAEDVSKNETVKL